MHEFEDKSRRVGPLALDYEWTGWTYLPFTEDDRDVGNGAPVNGGQASASSGGAKRAAQDMSGNIYETDQQAHKAPMLDHEDE